MQFEGVIWTGKSISDKTYDALPKYLQEFYDEINGVIAYEGGLQIRSCSKSPKWNSLYEFWKGDSALYKAYDGMTETDIPFAQDCLGDQYFMRNDQVHLLNSENGAIDNLGIDFWQFIDNCVNDPEDFLDLEPLIDFLEGGDSLEPGELLHIFPPFSLAESEEGVTIMKLPIEDRMSFLIDLNNQIKNMKDGDTISINDIYTQGED